MASNATTFLKFGFCFVLLVSLECRVIKIIDDSDSTNDIIVKIILKHNKKENHPKLKNEEKTILKEILEDMDQDKVESKIKEILEETKNEAHKNLSHKEEGHEKITNFLSGLDNFEMSKKELPDNLFEDSEESKDESTSNNMIDKDPENHTSEFIPNFDSRSGIQVGSCPSGFIRRGPLCLPADK